MSDVFPPKLPSPETAFKRSLFLTVVPTVTLVLSAPGLIVGPSTGFFYGGKPGRGWAGIGLRVVALGGMIASFAICPWDCGPGDDSYAPALAVFAGSGTLLVGSVVYDIATVKQAIRDNNERRLGRTIVLTPAYSLKSRTVGLRLQLSF